MDSVVMISVVGVDLGVWWRYIFEILITPRHL